ncbi:hypothetical protein Tco_0271425, partial [Tanacetum coccineum]
MANLEFVDQHNMVACLEKIGGNSEFREIVDFRTSSLIHHALTVSPTIYTSYIEKFWNTASSQTVNDVKQINATVDIKAVVVTEASIRSSLLFNDADGTACLTNEAIFQNLALMGYEAEGEGSGEPTEPQHTPSPTQPSTRGQPPETSSSHAITQDSRESLEGTNRNEGDQVQTPHDSSRPARIDVDASSRPARFILTLKPLPTIDPKDKGKGVLKESPVKKVKRSDLDAAQIAKDAKIARLVHENELTEMEREREERQRQDQASVDYIASLYDEVQAKMDASEELAARLQMEESKYRHNQLNKKTFEEIQALYIKEQEKDADFVPIGSERDEKIIDKINKKAAGMDEEEVHEEPESTKVDVKLEGREKNIKKRSGRRLKMKATKKSKMKKTDSDLEEEEQLRASQKIVPNKEEEIDYDVLECLELMKVHNIKTFTKMVSRFDILDFIELHSLVMQRFSITTPEGIDLVLWGDLRIMFEKTADDDI